MEYNEYKAKFTLAALNEGLEERDILQLLAYAENLYEKKLPVIYDTEHFCLLVGFSQEYILSAIVHPASFYWSFNIKKANGKLREISEPLPNLKEIQYWILENILYKIPVSAYAKAYVPEKRLKENVRFHKKQKIVLTMDLKDFFGSIRLESIKKIFRDLGYTHSLSNLMAKLCCLNDSLPQGAPTSPYLSNLYMLDFDMQVSSYCKDRRIRYTRYADDLTFSGDFEVNQMKDFIREQVGIKHLTINEEKTRCMDSNHRQIVTGIVVNEKLQVPKEVRRNIRLQMHYIQKFGLESHLQRISCTRQHYIYHLLGKIDFILSMTPQNQEFQSYRQCLMTYL